ncbi:MAG: hypothetical protein LUH82_07455 [Clostridiales bacterium]|nr:hypothetical protein [Clostridiales bacterium]
MVALKLLLHTAYNSEKAAGGLYLHIAKLAEKNNCTSASELCKTLSKSENVHADMIKSCLDKLGK